MRNSSSASHGSGWNSARAPARASQREHQQQRDQDQPDIACQQQQAEIDRKQEPVAALAFADRAPVVQQRQRPERRRQDRRAEIRRSVP